LLKDSKSSFAIEGERASGARATRWAQAIAQAGARPLSLHELERLQRVVIGDARFVHLGLRTHGGFVGVHERLRGEPVPDHISAGHQDLADLVSGVCDFDERAERSARAPSPSTARPPPPPEVPTSSVRRRLAAHPSEG
jgi:hypothetical protein